MSVLIVIPTVTGREIIYERCKLYHHVRDDYRILTRKDWPTCGEVWNASYDAIVSIGFDYVLLSADDLLPHYGWYEAAKEIADSGRLPNPALYNPDGHRWHADAADGQRVAFPRVPFMTVEQWRRIGPVPPIHYYSDVYIGEQASRLGIETVQCDAYAFTHLWAQEGRYHDRDATDHLIYEEWLAR